MPTYYDVLGVESDCSDAELRSAYRKLTKHSHPDRDGSATWFRAVNEAWEALRTPELRKAYDASLRAQSETAKAEPGDPHEDAPVEDDAEWGEESLLNDDDFSSVSDQLSDTWTEHGSIDEPPSRLAWTPNQSVTIKVAAAAVGVALAIIPIALVVGLAPEVAALPIAALVPSLILMTVRVNIQSPWPLLGAILVPLVYVRVSPDLTGAVSIAGLVGCAGVIAAGETLRARRIRLRQGRADK